MLDREDGDQSFTHVVTGNRWVLLLNEILLFCVLINCASKRGPETGRMRAAVRIRDRVRETKDLVVVAIIILHHQVHEHIVLDLLLILVAKLYRPLADEHNRLGMDQLFILAELPDEFLDPELVKILLLAYRIDTFVDEVNFEPRIEERQLTQARGELRELK